MTVSKLGHPMLPDDPQASLRLELVGQLVAAQFALEGALAQFAGNSGALGQAQLQLTMLATLRQQIGNASPATLSAMSNEIVAAVAQAHSVIQQGRANLANSEASSASTTANARQVVQSVADDVFRQKLLDPYLEFSSAEDEEEYRKREQARDAEVKRLLALDTPEANKRAVALLDQQLTDAENHGAGRSADIANMRQRLQNADTVFGAPVPERDVVAPKPSKDTAASDDDDLSNVMAALQAAGVQTTNDRAPVNGHVIASALQTQQSLRNV